MTVHDIVYKLLQKHPHLRDNDHMLAWEVWEEQGIAGESMSKQSFVYMAENFESIRRSRQKIQEIHPELRSSDGVLKLKKQKQDTKGTFIYREEVTNFNEFIF